MVVSTSHVGYQMLREQDRLFWMSRSVRNIINYDNTMLCSIIGSVLSKVLEPFQVKHSFFRIEQMLGLESRGKIQIDNLLNEV